MLNVKGGLHDWGSVMHALAKTAPESAELQTHSLHLVSCLVYMA